MKTPREILLERHQAAEPKLDAIRQSVVAAVYDRRTTKITDSSPVTDRRHFWREFLFSLRWHLAGLGASWLVILVLNLNVGPSTTFASALPAAKIPPPQIILASLRENRRELQQLIQPAESSETRPAKLFPRQPRSERRDKIQMA